MFLYWVKYSRFASSGTNLDSVASAVGYNASLYSLVVTFDISIAFILRFWFAWAALISST